MTQRLNLKLLFVKILALFSVVRGYNLAMLVLAQYLASLFIFAPDKSHLEIIVDKKLNLIILASLLVAASGYIINNFYDLEKDELVKPIQTYINRFISQRFKLNTYLFLNTLALVIAALVSWRVLIFFFVYQFLVWFYSHRANKIVFLNNVYSVVLMVFPFFALFIYYENFALVIFLHAAFLFLLLLITDIIKDLTSYTADVIYDYSTLPIKIGIKRTKYVLFILLLTNIILAFYMAFINAIGYMRYFFIFSSVFMLFISFILLITKSKTHYKLIYLSFKALIATGVINILFIEINPLALQKIIVVFDV